MLVLYEEYLTGLGLAPATVRMYRFRLGQAIEAARELGVDLDSPTAVGLSKLRSAFPESNTTLRQVRCALGHWFDMQGKAAPLKALRVPKKPRYHWRGLETDEARRLAREATRWHPEGLAVLVALYMGLRREEIATMRWDRFSPDLSTYQVYGKGGYQDTIPVADDLKPLLEAHHSAYVWLFPGAGRRHVNPATISEWVKRVAKAADIDPRTIAPHRLRHTAIGFVCDTEGIRVAQRFARHVRIDTTQIYTRATEQQVRLSANMMPWLKDDDPEGERRIA
ncbi:MAG TPA: site-specific integrase [Acidimicrobiia bacterium]